MPRFDQTGPRGQGPRTGRGMGFCPPGITGFGAGFAPGMGWGRGGGMGFGPRANFAPGWGRMFWTQQDWQESLEDYRDGLKRELQAVEQELADLGE